MSHSSGMHYPLRSWRQHLWAFLSHLHPHLLLVQEGIDGTWVSKCLHVLLLPLQQWVHGNRPLWVDVPGLRHPGSYWRTLIPLAHEMGSLLRHHGGLHRGSSVSRRVLGLNHHPPLRHYMHLLWDTDVAGGLACRIRLLTSRSVLLLALLTGVRIVAARHLLLVRLTLQSLGRHARVSGVAL